MSHRAPGIFPKEADIGEQVRFLCEYGVLAPSVHNIQPWELRFDAERLTIGISKQRLLTHGDPTGRETWLSIGCFLENVLLAGQFYGLEAQYRVDESSRDVHVQWRPATPQGNLQRLVEAIDHRHSNRHPFTARPIAESTIQQLSEIRSDGAYVRMATDSKQIELIAGLTGKAISLAFSNPAFREELAELIRPSGSKRKHGLFGHALAVPLHRAHGLEKHYVRRGWNRQAQAAKEARMVRTAPALCLVFASGDVPKFWVEAGRAYQRAGLTAAAEGLAQSTTAAVVEAADFHTDIARLFDTTDRLQAVLRVGHSSKQSRHSPRLSVADVTTSP